MNYFEKAADENAKALNEYGLLGKSEIDLAIHDYHRIYSLLDGFAGVANVTKAALDAAPIITASQFAAFPYNVYVRGVYVYSTRQIYGLYATTSAPVTSQPFILEANKVTYIPIKFIIRGLDAIKLTLISWLDSVTTDAVVRVSWDGYKFANEFITNAKVNACIIGTSINAGASASRLERMFNFMLKNELRKRGVSLAIPWNKSISGSQSETHLNSVRDSKYIIPGCRLYIIELGANDSQIGSVPKSTYKANIKEMTELLLCSESNPVVLIEAPTLNENDTSEALNVQYRAAVSEIISEIGSDRLFFVDLGTGSFDRKVTSNYMGTDTPGVRIHPSDAGNASIYNNCIVPFLNSVSGQSFIGKLKSFN